MVTFFLVWSTTSMIIAYFTCIMCKMACIATNGIYGVQSYKGDKDVYPIHIIFNFLNIGIKITFHQVNKPMR